MKTQLSKPASELSYKLGRSEVNIGSVVGYFLINPVSIIRATIAVRDETRSLAKMRRKCVPTVHELILSTAAIVLLG